MNEFWFSLIVYQNCFVSEKNAKVSIVYSEIISTFFGVSNQTTFFTN